LTQFVIPAQAGIQFLDYYNDLDPRSRQRRASGSEMTNEKSMQGT